MRVLSVQHYPAFGGPHNEIVNLEPHLNDLGVETIVALTDFPGDAFDRISGHVEVHRIPLGRFRQPSHIRANVENLRHFRRDIANLRGLIQSTRPDVVKIHGVHNPQGAIAAKKEGIPVTLVISSDLPHPIFRQLGMKYLGSRVDSVLTTGTRILSAYPGHEAVADRMFSYVPPVDTGKFIPGTDVSIRQARHALEVTQDEFVVGTVANVNPQKGIDILVDVAQTVLREIPGAKFVIVGNVADTQKEYYASIVSAIEAKGISSKAMRFLGGRQDVHTLLPGFDVMVLPSRAEGIPTTVLEAMSVGLPVVCTDVGSVSEVVLSGENGIVVQSGDVAALATSIMQLKMNSGLRRDIGIQARKSAVESFGVDRCAETHERAFKAALLRG